MAKWMIIVALPFAGIGCTSDSGGDNSDVQVACERLDVDESSYCTYQQPITETGYECPQDLPNAIPFEGHTVCSQEDELPEEHKEPIRDHLAGASAGEDAGLDIEDTDTSDDTTDSNALTCENVESRWRDFVADNRACETDDDCALVSDWESCNCTPSLTGSGTAITKDATGTAQAFLDVYHSEECEPQAGLCDAAPADEVWCDEGTCRANSPSCLPPPDAGGG